MAIENDNSRNNYVGLGNLATYAYTFLIREAEHLRVTKKDLDLVEYPLELGVDYSVTGVEEEDGGTITLTAGNLTTGWGLSIRRVVPVVQSTDLRNQGSYYPETIELGLDDLAMIDQQQQDEIDRSMKLPETIDPAAFDTQLPSELIGSPNRAFGTNPDGTAFAVGPSFGDIQGAADSADAAAVSEANAAASAAAAAVSAAEALASEQAAQTAESGAVAANASAGSSASAAAISAAAALVSQNAADTRATAASVSETNAGNSATAALASQDAAATSATNAATSETNAAASAAAAGSFAYVDFNDSSTGVVTALDTTTGGRRSIRMTGAAPDIQGIASGVDGKILYLAAIGGDIILRHENAGASAANRLHLGAAALDVTVKQGTVAILKYDDTTDRWRLAGGAGGGSETTITDFTAAGITLGQGKDQVLRYTGVVPLTVTSITHSAMPAGGRVSIMALNNDYPLTVPDTVTGAQNGDKVLNRGGIVRYVKDSSLGLVEDNYNGL